MLLRRESEDLAKEKYSASNSAEGADMEIKDRITISRHFKGHQIYYKLVLFIVRDPDNFAGSGFQNSGPNVEKLFLG